MELRYVELRKRQAMVYLKEHINKIKEGLESNNLGTIAYYHFKQLGHLQSVEISNFVGQEVIAVKGYLGIQLSEEEEEKILKAGFKGIDISSTIFKLIGAYFASPEKVGRKVDEKFKETSIKNKYFISRLIPNYNQGYVEDLSKTDNSEYWVFKFLQDIVPFTEANITGIDNFLTSAFDVIDLMILEELHLKLLMQQVSVMTIQNFSALQIILRILNNFHTSVKKLTDNRRAGHDVFKINDEYDVQDLLYTMLKGIFPTLKEEDPVPRVGVKSSRIDLIIREERILIEVKMIKESDTNEKIFIDQLKKDIQSYHASEWIKHLICFVYDPYCKTQDKQNFYDLNGKQSINQKEFSINVIVNPV